MQNNPIPNNAQIAVSEPYNEKTYYDAWICHSNPNYDSGINIPQLTKNSTYPDNKITRTIYTVPRNIPELNKELPTQISNRLTELEKIAKEDGGQQPVKASKDLLKEFFKKITPSKMPEITLTDDGLYYVRIIKGDQKLVICFLEDQKVQYLIEESNGYLENCSTLKFFINQHTTFIRTLI